VAGDRSAVVLVTSHQTQTERDHRTTAAATRFVLGNYAERLPLDNATFGQHRFPDSPVRGGDDLDFDRTGFAAHRAASLIHERHASDSSGQADPIAALACPGLQTLEGSEVSPHAFRLQTPE
jgi:hypothetical protein